MPTLQEQTDENTSGVRTSGKTRTMINYKQFLEEYADAPPSPPKRQSTVDFKLKRRPSKERIAAEKYKSKFITKPTTLPRPVYNKRNCTKTSIAPGPVPVSNQLHANQEQEIAPTSKTVLTPTTSAETRHAIDALLLLGELPPTGTNPTPDDNNSLLVPILGHNEPQIGSENPFVTPQHAASKADANDNLILDNQNPEIPPNNDDLETTDTPVILLPGTVLGTVVKTDVEAKTTTDKADPKPVPVKKELSFKQYGIKRKYKQMRMFKCKMCPSEMPSVQEYNKHYLDCHPPQPCLDCTGVFTLPGTLAKHCYTHAEYMYECQDCSCGFILKSQLKSHSKVHLKMSGFVCFKPKCGRHFKRELELNAHLVAHSKNKIKCDHCDYSNSDIQNVHAHSRVHSEKLPYHCPLCNKGFKWQEQKCRHLRNCEGD